MASSLIQMLVSLALVLALIAGTAWFLRRLQNGRMGQHGPLRLRGQLMVGPRERVIVIEVEGQWIVAGVTSSEVSPLLVIPAPEHVGGESEPAPAGIDFQSLLRRARGVSPQSSNEVSAALASTRSEESKG